MNYKSEGNHWVVDSGCTQHMTGDPRKFTTLSEDTQGHEKITFGGSEYDNVEGVGNIDISQDHTLSNVLMVDSLGFNLLSVAQLCDHGYKVIFEEGMKVRRKTNE